MFECEGDFERPFVWLFSLLSPMHLSGARRNTSAIRWGDAWHSLHVNAFLVGLTTCMSLQVIMVRDWKFVCPGSIESHVHWHSLHWTWFLEDLQQRYGLALSRGAAHATKALEMNHLNIHSEANEKIGQIPNEFAESVTAESAEHGVI